MKSILHKPYTLWITLILMLGFHQVYCQKNLTSCDSKINASDQSPCCLNGCDVIREQNRTQACECPKNMTLQNVTGSALYKCTGSGSNVTNTSVTEDDFIICWNTCPNGTYIEEGVTSRKCSVCSDECTTCSGAGTLAEVCDCKHYVQDNRCVPKCNDGFYGDETQTCVKCDNLCKSCTAAGTDINVCNCKFKYNNTCVESCPNGTSNTNGLCTKPSESPEDDSLIIIIAAAAGGGGAVIIIIIVIVICCCCRKKRRKTRMSTIIEERDLSDDKLDKDFNPENIQLPTKKPKKNKRPNYENMPGQDDSKVANIAQQALDKKYRYVRDPTETMKNKQKNQSDSDPEYHNQETINRHKTFSDKGVFKAVSKKWKKSKKAVKNRFSKNMSEPKKRGANRGDVSDSNYLPMGSKKKMEPEVTQEEYLDLEAPQLSASNAAFQQEDYEPLDMGAGSHGATSADVHVEQEDYMNIEYNTNKNNVEDNFEQELYENFDPNERRNIADHNQDSIEQEDYENYEPKNRNVQNTSSTSNENDDNYDEEDYENTPSKRVDDDDDEEHSYVNASAFRRY